MKAPSARLPATEELGALAVYHVSPADKQRGAACAGRHLSQGRVAATSSLPPLLPASSGTRLRSAPHAPSGAAALRQGLGASPGFSISKFK